MKQIRNRQKKVVTPREVVQKNILRAERTKRTSGIKQGRKKQRGGADR